MKVTRISLDRLYNLGSYEHVKYSLTVEVPEGESAATALIGLEKIITALEPESKACIKSQNDLDREKRRIQELCEQLGSLSEDDFRHKHGWFEGTPNEYADRIEQAHLAEAAKRLAWLARAAKARKMLDDLGGAANWKDAKLDWEDDNDFS